MRLRQVALAARDLEPALLALQRVLGLGEPFRDPGVAEFGLENGVLPIGDAFLEVVSPAQPDTTAGRWIERRGGDAGYMAIFQTDDLAAARARDGGARRAHRLAGRRSTTPRRCTCTRATSAARSSRSTRCSRRSRGAGPGRAGASAAAPRWRTAWSARCSRRPTRRSSRCAGARCSRVRPDRDAEGAFTLALERGTRVRLRAVRATGASRRSSRSRSPCATARASPPKPPPPACRAGRRRAHRRHPHHPRLNAGTAEARSPIAPRAESGIRSLRTVPA